MKISATYSGKYLKAADVPTPRTLVIQSVTEVTFDERSKLAIRFQGDDQQLVLNKTNALTLADAFGDETDLWGGKHIQIFVVPTFFQGKQVKGLCVQPLIPPSGTHGQISAVTDQTSQAATSPTSAASPSPAPPPQPSTPPVEPSVQAPSVDYSE